MSSTRASRVGVSGPAGFGTVRAAALLLLGVSLSGCAPEPSRRFPSAGAEVEVLYFYGSSCGGLPGEGGTMWADGSVELRTADGELLERARVEALGSLPDPTWGDGWVWVKTLPRWTFDSEVDEPTAR